MSLTRNETDYRSKENMRCHNVGSGGVTEAGMTFFPSHKNMKTRRNRAYQMACRVYNATGQRERLAQLRWAQSLT